MYRPRFGKYFFAEVAAQTGGGVQVHSSSQQFAQIVLHPEKCESWRMTWLELNQYVHIAIWPKIVAKHRPEK